MDTEARREAILVRLSREGYVSLGDLSDEFGVAPVTIHRDLDHLGGQGRLERVRGGARATSDPHIKSDHAYRFAHASAEKQAMARRALLEVPDGATVFLDSSTSVEAMGALLGGVEGRSIGIVTNSPAIAYHIHAPAAHVIVTPGELDQQLRAVTGRWTAEFLSSLNIDTAFVSAAGVTPSGLMTTQRELAEVIKAAFSRSRRRIALIDSSKFDTSALIAMAPLEALDLVITDQGIDPAVRARYEDFGVRFAIADAEAPS